MLEKMPSQVIVPSNVVRDSILGYDAKQCQKGWHLMSLCRAMSWRITSQVTVLSNAIRETVPYFQDLIHLNWIRFNQFLEYLLLFFRFYREENFHVHFKNRKLDSWHMQNFHTYLSIIILIFLRLNARALSIYKDLVFKARSTFMDLI